MFVKIKENSVGWIRSILKGHNFNEIPEASPSAEDQKQKFSHSIECSVIKIAAQQTG